MGEVPACHRGAGDGEIQEIGDFGGFFGPFFGPILGPKKGVFPGPEKGPKSGISGIPRNGG